MKILKTQITNHKQQKKDVNFGMLDTKLTQYIAKNYNAINKIAIKEDIGFFQLFQKFKSDPRFRLQSYNSDGSKMLTLTVDGIKIEDMEIIGKRKIFPSALLSAMKNIQTKLPETLAPYEKSGRIEKIKEFNTMYGKIEQKIFQKKLKINSLAQDLLEIKSKEQVGKQASLISSQKKELKKLKESLEIFLSENR